LPWQLNFEKKIALTVDTQRNIKILDHYGYVNNA